MAPPTPSPAQPQPPAVLLPPSVTIPPPTLVHGYPAALAQTGAIPRIDLPIAVAPTPSRIAPEPPQPVEEYQPYEEPAPQPAFRPQPAPQRFRISFVGVCKSEWVKLFTLNSTWWVIGVTIVVSVGLGAVVMLSMRTLMLNANLDVQMSPRTIYATAAAASSSSGTSDLLEIILGVLAVLFITNEYSSGQIRSTLTAVPKRWPMLAAKALIIAVVGYVVSFIAHYGAIIAGWPVVAGIDTSTLPSGWGLVDDRFTVGTLKTMALMSLSTVFVLIFALAVGALVRNTAAGISVLVIVLLILPMIVQFLPWDWSQSMLHYLLSASQMGVYNPDASTLSFASALWVTAAWAVVPLVAAGVLLRTRDA